MPESDPTLSPKEYRALLRDIKTHVTESKKRPADRKIGAYWSIGKRISEEKLTTQVGYTSSVIKDLAADVGLAGRTLYDAVQFFSAYATPPQGDALSWTHHRLLLKLDRKKDRTFYINALKKHGWSSRELDAAIKRGLHEGGKKASLILKRPTAPEYIYGAEVLEIIDGDTLDLEIDLGFNVYRKIRVRLASINAPERATKKGRAARDFVTQKLLGAQTCAVKTIRIDLHGRYVVHLFFTHRRISISATFQNGDHLNDLLAQEGHARVVS